MVLEIVLGVLVTISLGLAGWGLANTVKVKTYVAVVDAKQEARHEEYDRRFTEHRKDLLDLKREHIAGNRAIAASLETVHEKLTARLSALQADINVVKVTCARVGHTQSDQGKVT